MQYGAWGFGMIAEINLRTTTVYSTPSGALVKIPNSKMVAGSVENWSQNIGDLEEYKSWYEEGESTINRGLDITVEIDGISADQSITIYDALKEMLENDIKGISKKNTVRFKAPKGNARVFQIWASVNDIDEFWNAEKNINLGILRILEREGIETLNVLLRTDPQSFREAMKARELN